MSSIKLQPDWWVRVPEGERPFLRVLMGKIEDVAEGGAPEVAGFARIPAGPTDSDGASAF